MGNWSAYRARFNNFECELSASVNLKFSCRLCAERALEGGGRLLRITLSRASDCAKYEITLDVALHFGLESRSCAEKPNKNNDQVARGTVRTVQVEFDSDPGHLPRFAGKNVLPRRCCAEFSHSLDEFRTKGLEAGCLWARLCPYSLRQSVQGRVNFNLPHYYPLGNLSCWRSLQLSSPKRGDEHAQAQGTERARDDDARGQCSCRRRPSVSEAAGSADPSRRNQHGRAHTRADQQCGSGRGATDR